MSLGIVWAALSSVLIVLVAISSFAWIWIIYRRGITLSRLNSLGKSCNDSISYLSVIIPARNVERWVEWCLSSLLRQGGVKGEILLVDDSSEDGTARIVLNRFLNRGVKYVRVGLTPRGWLGKNWACWRGYGHSRGEWLLFMDADTVLLDECVLSDALKRCEKDLDALSLVPRLDTGSLSSKIMLPLLQNILWSLFPPTRSNDPRDPAAILFGAFILVKRSVYEGIGGHEAVRSRVLEDRALASILKGRGYKILLLNGSERIVAEFAGSIRGYVDAIKRLVADYALTHNLSPLKYYLAGAVIHLLLPQVVLVGASFYGLNAFLLPASSSVVLNLAANLLELRRLKVKRGLLYTPLTLLANWVLVAAIMKSYLATTLGRVELTWRGRRIRT
ncbi:MAG: glycosyltransferase family A protein [Nitrososphaerota archaeon]|nr:glycosyltransferase family 2 protein [Candidatus Calditenuaceae archaeon]MDW8073089.1 glycosyltransferase family A protein [Nitrososphaerota archaeon]